MSSARHLWEYDHPYYCNEGNFFQHGLHERYESWDDFHAEWGDADPDLNLVFRWDWKRADPDDYEPGADLPPDKLLVHWVLQRKAILRSTECVVTEADEPAALAWLTERAITLRAIWDPVLGERGGNPDE